MSRAWTERELETLRNAYDAAGDGPLYLDSVVETIGRSRAAVAMKASRLGLADAHRQRQPEHLAALHAAKTAPPCPENPWTDEEIQVLRNWYAAREGTAANRRALAKKLGRSQSAISHKAVRLGLSGPRPNRWNDEVPHPRGALGLKHTAATRNHIGDMHRARMAAMTPEQRGAHILAGLKTKAERGDLVRPRPKTTWKQDWHTIGGKRHFFRSKWEVNYAHYLEWLKSRGEIAEWEYEPTTFWFEAIKRGVRSYTPDFRVTEKSGAVAYHEIKGWMDDRSATKLKRMKKYHPEVRMVLVDSKSYKALHRQVLGLVPGWC